MNRRLLFAILIIGFFSKLPAQDCSSLKLMQAAEAGNADALEKCLDAGIRLDSRVDTLGNTLLHLAAEAGQYNIAEIILQAGADANAVRANGSTPLMIAVSKRDLALAKLLIKYKAQAGYIRPQDESSPLHMAAQWGAPEAVQLLLDNGAYVNGQSETTGITPLLMAAFYNRPEALDILLEAGADAQAVTAQQQTALHVSILGFDQLSYEIYEPADKTSEEKLIAMGELELRHEKTIKRLLEAGVDKTAKDYTGKLALDYAIEAPSTETAIQLLQDWEASEQSPGNTPDVKTRMGHTDGVSALEFAPGGKTIVSGGADKMVKIWDVATKSEARSFQAHDGSLTNLDLSSDGLLLLTSCYDNKNNLKLWNLQSGELIRSFSGHGAPVTRVQFLSGDAQFISSSWDGTLKLWDAAAGEAAHTFRGHQDEVNAFAISEDGRLLVSGSRDGEIFLWDLTARTAIGQLKEHQNSIRALAISPGQKRLASATDWGQLFIWNLETRQIERRVNLGVWTEVARFFDGSRYILAGAGGTFKTIDANTGEIVKSVPGHARSINDFSFSPDGQYLASGSSDHSMKIWSIDEFIVASNTARRPAPLQKNDNQTHVLKAKFIGNSRIAVGTRHSAGGTYGNSVKVFDWQDGSWLQDFEGATGNVSAITVSEDGQLLAAGISFLPAEWDGLGLGHQDSIKVWNLDSRKRIQTFSGHNGETYSLQFTPGNTHIISSAAKNPELGDLENILEDLERFHQFPDIQMWNIQSGQTIRRFEGHSMDAPSLCLIPNAALLVTGAYDTTVRTWDYQAGKLITTDAGFMHPVAASPDGRFLLAGSAGAFSGLSLWDRKSNSRVTLQGHRMAPLDAAFSPSGKYAVTGGMDGNVVIWDIQAKKLRHLFSGHDDEVISVDIGPEERYVISTSIDNTLRFIEMSTGKEALKMQLYGERDWLLSSPDGYYAGSKGFIETISFHFGGENYTYDQFDLKFNRPDLVFGKLAGFSDALRQAYFRAYQKRLEKMDFTEAMLAADFHVPALIITSALPPPNTSEKRLSVTIEAQDEVAKLDRINVYINDVPIYGRAGINLRPLGTHGHKRTIELELSEGENKVQFSVLNQRGAESARQSFYVRHEAPASRPKLYLIAIGANQYEDTAHNLPYAKTDAESLTRFFQGPESPFREVVAECITGPEVTLERIQSLKKLLLQTQVDDRVILFFAGHGVLDDNLDYYLGSYGMDFGNPGGQGIPYEVFEDLLDSIPARRKLLLVDACHSGEIDKESVALIRKKNTSDGEVTFRSFANSRAPAYKQTGLENSFELMKQLFVDLRRGTGANVISSAAGVEFAVEGKKWNNGVFTYALLKGLREREADRDGDGQILVSELQRYVEDQVLELTDGHQRPGMRRENISNDWRVW